MTSPLDRAALADALASATADDLREDAEVCRSALAYAGNDRTAASLQRLAALALATAALMEKNAAEPGTFATVIRLSFEPRALAALLKGDQ